jgi:hypothetical protein
MFYTMNFVLPLIVRRFQRIAFGAGVLCIPTATFGDTLDQISGADLYDPIPSWLKFDGAPLPPQAEVTGQLFFDVFVVEQPTLVHAVEAAISFEPSGAESMLSTGGVIVHLDGPEAFTARAGWGNNTFPGFPPNSGIIDDGVAPGIDLYRREFNSSFGLVPGTYALAVFGFENDFFETFVEDRPWEFKVYQSSEGDEEGFVWPAVGDPWYAPFEYDFDFGNYEIQFVNAAYRLETTIIPAPGVLALALPMFALAGRRRRS